MLELRVASVPEPRVAGTLAPRVGHLLELWVACRPEPRVARRKEPWEGRQQEHSSPQQLNCLGPPG